MPGKCTFLLYATVYVSSGAVEGVGLKKRFPSSYTKMKLHTVINVTVLLFVSFSLLEAASSKRPNIILMMADDCGYEALACN